MKEKKSCLHCMNASVTEEQGATFCLCDFDTDCIYISDPEKRQKNAKAMSEWRKNENKISYKALSVLWKRAICLYA